jgi:hypothetical protein
MGIAKFSCLALCWSTVINHRVLTIINITEQRLWLELLLGVSASSKSVVDQFLLLKLAAMILAHRTTKVDYRLAKIQYYSPS